MNQRRAAIVFVLLLAGAILSGLLLLQHHGEGPAVTAVQTICGDGGQNGCETVARSAYSAVGGVPLAAVGLFFYVALASLLALALLASPAILAAGGRLVALALLLALAIDVLLFGIQAFSIRAYCKLCLTTYAVNLVALLVLLPALREASALGTLISAEGRLILAGWVLTCGATAAALLAADLTLSSREARRAASLLGDPSVSATGRSAEDEVRRLKDILDDPQKREQYVTDKAVKEFEDAIPQVLDVSKAPIGGSAGSPIHVVEFSDYLCPFCRSLAGAFKDFIPKSQGRVVVHFKNYPLDKTCNPKLQSTVHEGACWLAFGAICAQEQGRFAAYQDAVFATPARPMGRDDAVRIATAAGLAAPTLQTCLDSPDTKGRLASEIEEADRVGVKGTPTLFINGKRLPRVNDFLTAIEKEGHRLGLPPLPSPPAKP
jgi:protein-disulfide isomerase/uncharacterized membrane protein